MKAKIVGRGETPSGKQTTTYEVEVPTREEARAAIPGDFLVVWEYEHAGVWSVEVVRTF